MSDGLVPVGRVARLCWAPRTLTAASTRGSGAIVPRRERCWSVVERGGFRELYSGREHLENVRRFADQRSDCSSIRFRISMVVLSAGVGRDPRPPPVSCSQGTSDRWYCVGLRRAYGGCLGKESMKDVGGCDKPGERNGFDPGVSEWGNPAGVMAAARTRMHRVRGGTRGSETSQYPQEEKTTVIP